MDKDYIPLNSKKKARNFPNNTSCRVDKRLLAHVREYLENSSEDMIDIESMADDLHKIREYARKKRNPFYAEVEKAFNIISKEAWYRNKTMSSPEFSSDNENYVEIPDNDLVNQSLCKLYASKPKTEDKTTTKKEENDVQIVEETNKKRKRKKAETPIEEITKKKPKKNDVSVTHSTVTFKDMGGCESILIRVCNLVFHLNHPEIHSKLGIKPPRGILIHGPPGCGKTMLANAIAGELKLPILKMASTELVSGISGESEEKIREVFDKAVANAPCILFIDEIDAITRKRESAQREMEVRIVSQLLMSMDDLNTKDAKTQVLVLGATNRPDALDPALRRGGRFDNEINVPIPDEAARIRLMKVLCNRVNIDGNLDFIKLARQTPGFVGADLEALTTAAGSSAINRVLESLQNKVSVTKPDSDIDVNLQNAISLLSSEPLLTPEELNNLCINFSDFETALTTVQPSSKREGFSTVPDVTWDDVGALKEVQEELRMCITVPIHYAETCEKLGKLTAAGILLFGPPGCGKTLLAKAIANESGLNFISVKGPELINMYVGESERGIRTCFERARNSAPCVIFFDEFDALCQKRGGNSNHEASTRLVNQLLTEMDGFNARKNVFIIAATNRPDNIDPAMLRPNRLGKLIYVGLPCPQARVEILQTITKNGTRPPLADDVDLNIIGVDNRCEGFTGADLNALVQEAADCVLKEIIGNLPDAKVLVAQRHFEVAFNKVRRSVSAKDQKVYDKMRNKLDICET